MAKKLKNIHAVKLGSLGGKKGGPARDRALTKSQKKEIAHKGADARWRAHEAGKKGTHRKRKS